MTLRRAAALVVAVLAVVSGPGRAFAEDLPWFGLKLEGDVSAGVRGFINEPKDSEKAKLEEYRDLGSGPFLEGARLRLLNRDESYVTEFGGRNWGRQDQEYFLNTGRTGLWGFDFGWDQTPHIFSTNSRSFETQTSEGIFTLPSTRPLLSDYNNATRIDEIGVRWDTAKIGLYLTPTPDLDLRVDYSRIRKQGDKPSSLVFGGPGNNFTEYAAPVDQTIHDLTVSASWAKETWQLQLTYQFSMFKNELDSATVDNPCLGLGGLVTAGGCQAPANAGIVPTAGAINDATNAPAKGRISQEPDNQAHTISLQGGINLPMRTRVALNASTSLQLQNQSFLPYTVNAGIIGNPANAAALALPQDSLNGFVQTTLVNLNVSSRPLAPLTLTGKYRFFNYEDKSDRPDVHRLSILDDRCSNALCTVTLGAGEEAERRPNFTRHNVDLDARLRIVQPVAFTVGGGWERWERGEEREVQRSDEYFAKAALDVTPADWMSARLTYRPSFRRTGGYDSMNADTGNSPLARKFDEAERDRQRVDLLLQFTPVETFDAAVSMGYRYDDYLSSRLGLRSETSWSAGLELNWTPIDRVTVSAGYVHEVNNQLLRARSTFTGSGTVADYPDMYWDADMTDTVDTFHAGVKAVLIPKVLDFLVGGSYSVAVGRQDLTNPNGTPAHGTASDIAQATVRGWPTVQDELVRLESSLRYHFLKSWTASLNYVFESFAKHDWRTDTLSPWVGITSIYLGSDAKDYTAHMIGATIAYHFR